MGFIYGILFAWVFLGSSSDRPKENTTTTPRIPFRERPDVAFVLSNMKANPGQFGGILALRLVGAALFAWGTLHPICRLAWMTIQQFGSTLRGGQFATQTPSPSITEMTMQFFRTALPWVLPALAVLAATDYLLKRASWLVPHQVK